MAQNRIPISIDPYPFSIDAQVGYPNPKYFRALGNKYTLIHRSVNNLNEKIYNKSEFRLRQQFVHVKTVSSNKLFPCNRKYILINDSIVPCNRFYRPLKNHCFTLDKSEIVNADSIYYKWTYNISKNDTLIDKSYREVYDFNRRLIKWETTWQYYAFDDSTWIMAEKSSSWGGVQRSFYRYINQNETSLIYERITSNTQEILSINIYKTYDSIGRLIEINEVDPLNNKTVIYKYTYRNNICTKLEIFVNGVFSESTEVISD